MNSLEALALYARRRDPRAFRFLVERYSGFVYATCRRRLASAEDVDDAVQEVFVSLARQADSIRSDVVAWLHTCAVRTCIDAIRRKKSRERREASYAMTTARPSDDDAGERQKVLAEVDQALAELPVAERSLILEYYLEGRTQQQIADDLKLTQSAVKRRLDRALEQLRRALDKRGLQALPALIVATLAAEAQAAAAPQALTAKLIKLGLAGVGPAKGSLLAGAVGAKVLLALLITAGTIAGSIAATGAGRDAIRIAFASADSLPAGPNFGQTPPGMTPLIYAPGTISLPERRETAVVESPADNSVLLSLVDKGQFTIMQSMRSAESWSPFKTPPFIGLDEAREPFVSPDGMTLLFIRHADIWRSEFIEGAWTMATPLPWPINTAAEEWCPSMTAEGTVYFESSRDLPQGRYNNWRCRLEDGQYRTATRLPTAINGARGAGTPMIAPDESYLIFGTRWAGGFGQADMFIAHKNPDGSWTSPVNLGAPLNTSANDYASRFSRDGKYFFFTRCQAYGAAAPADIYWVDARAVKGLSP